MLRITWNGIALHGGPLPGYAASHGCVRMPFGFAEKLFDKVPMNTRIIISPNDAEPVEISHPALFVPNPEALAAAPGARRNARPRSGRGRQDGQTGEESARSARGVAEQAGTGSTPGPRRSSRPRSKGSPLPRQTRPRPRPRTSSRRQPQGPRSCARSSTPPRQRARPSSRSCRSRCSSAARRRNFTFGATRMSRCRTAGEMFDFAIRGSGHHPQSQPADRHACDHGGGEHRRGPALDSGHGRRRGRRQGRARPHHHPAGGDRSPRARRHCRGPRSSSRMSRCTARPTIARSSLLR